MQNTIVIALTKVARLSLPQMIIAMILSTAHIMLNQNRRAKSLSEKLLCMM